MLRLPEALSASGGDTWQFIYDPTASVPSVLAEVKNGTVEAFYVREPGGELLARVAGAARQYYFFDGLGSTQAICPASEGNPTDRYFHTPWGEPDTRNESLSGTPGNPYRYVGQLGYYHHHQDANLSDWMQLGVRFYQPQIGRFERRDPVWAVTGVYAYCEGQPVHGVDPTGLLGAGSGWGFGGRIGAGVLIGASCFWVGCHNPATCTLDFGLVCSACLGVATPGIAILLGPLFSTCSSLDDLTGWSSNLGFALPIGLGGELGLGTGQGADGAVGGHVGIGTPGVWAARCFTWIVVRSSSGDGSRGQR